LERRAFCFRKVAERRARERNIGLYFHPFLRAPLSTKGCSPPTSCRHSSRIYRRAIQQRYRTGA
jgi:hypothetical protein